MDGSVVNRSRSSILATPRARDVVALTKPRITLMVLITAAGGIWLAPGPAHTATIVYALLGTALIVGGANALNMFIERDIDGLMKRTKDRPLPAGRMSPRFALIFGVVLSLAAVPVLALGVNATTALLALLANLLYLLAYTPLKQRSHWALQVGAVPGAIPPLLGWTAATGRVDDGGLVLFAILFLWQIAHFHAIALFRKLEYGRAHLVVLPNVEGDDAARHSIVRHASALAFVSLLLYPLHVAHRIYLVSALVLGVGFVVASLFGLRKKVTMRWARGVFIASLFYLVGLFAAIAVDAFFS
ncbi:MAG TPA: heme o synthase [Polyangiaceae bacterium]|jgi:protoheme IX farnesyltransferase